MQSRPVVSFPVRCGVVHGLVLGLAAVLWSRPAEAALVVGKESNAFVPTHATVTVFERHDGATVRWAMNYRGEAQSLLVVLPLADCAIATRFETGDQGLINHLSALSGPLMDTNCEETSVDSHAMLQPTSAGTAPPDPSPLITGGAAYTPSFQARVPAGQWREGLKLAREWGFPVDPAFRSALDDTRRGACSLLFYVVEADGQVLNPDHPLPTVVLESSGGPGVFPSAPLNPSSPTRVLQLIFALARSSDGVSGQRAISELDNYVAATGEDLGRTSPARIAHFHGERVNRFFEHHPIAALTEFASNPSARIRPDGGAVTCHGDESNYTAFALTKGEMLQLSSHDNASRTPEPTPILTRILAASNPRRTPILTLEPIQSVWGGFRDLPAVLSEATDPFYQVHYRFEGRACVATAICEPTSALTTARSGPLESPESNEHFLIRHAEPTNPPPISSVIACAVNEAQPDPIVWVLLFVIGGHRRRARLSRTSDQMRATAPRAPRRAVARSPAVDGRAKPNAGAGQLRAVGRRRR